MKEIVPDKELGVFARELIKEKRFIAEYRNGGAKDVLST